MAELNVNPGDLVRFASSYEELATHASTIAPQTDAEIARIAQTHGPIGAPVAAGLAAGFQAPQTAITQKTADFTQYSQRLTEHAATYTTEDRAAAARMKAGDDFDLDPQYVRPAGLPGGAPVPEGTLEITIGTGGITMTVVQVTQTKTWWTQPPRSGGKHCV